MAGSSENTKQERALIFLHIPKAGGSTIRWIISHQYGSSAIFGIGHPDLDYQKAIDDFKKVPETQRAEIKVLVGHVGFGLHEFLHQPATYITMLREPVERVISFYYYARLKARSGDTTSFKDYILRGGFKQVNNGQTRLLSNVEGDFQDSVAYGECPGQMLTTAKQRLKEDFTAFGLVERFDESVLLFKRVLGWRTPLYTKVRVNKRRKPRNAISEDTLKAIKQYNQLDLQLYDYACNLFEDRVNQLGPSFQRELRRFKLLNLCYSRLYASGRGVYRQLHRS